MREWLVAILTGDAQFNLAFPGGLHQASSLVERPDVFPYCTYRFGASTQVLADDGVPATIQQPATLWGYDNPGDYQRIDDGLERIRGLLTAALGTPGSRVIRCTFAGSSDDMIDPDLNLILKNNRFQIYHLG